MKTLILLLVTLLSACASMPKDLTVEVGDSDRRLVHLFGHPSYNVPSVKARGARAWYYVRGQEVCGYQVTRGTVTRISGCIPYSEGLIAVINKIGTSEMLAEYQGIK